MAENLMSILAGKEIIKRLRLNQRKGTTTVERQDPEGLSAGSGFHRHGFQKTLSFLCLALSSN
jgi:hypothetical protein